MYYTVTKDFETFSKTKILLNLVIMLLMLQYLIMKTLFYDNKNETYLPEAKKTLHILFSDNLYDWDVPVSEAISWSWVEGPTITKINEEWVVYFNQYKKGSFGAISSSNLQKWKDISKKLNFLMERVMAAFLKFQSILSKIEDL